ncbi:MAG TPA: imidazole glycerol phosphate synthase subunit HisH [Candidatus Mailhella merdavium]|nr:imidazole glycerol phosphate synthase subunit HisH [Candidatus Mailhella merdavium]
MLAILDYKAGNQTSVLRALSALSLPARITSSPSELSSASGIIFPGVGAAGQAMGHLRDTGLDALLRELVASGKPLLGVCLGCQILLEHSEENDTRTLGILPGVCRRFDPAKKDGGEPLRIPHMGWNALHFKQKDCPLFEGIEDGTPFYFVHSYYPVPAPSLILADCDYGGTFAAVFGRPGLWAAQFHPEKSGPAGLRLLRNFYDYCHAHSEAPHA